jgi:hypothetical protein
MDDARGLRHGDPSQQHGVHMITNQLQRSLRGLGALALLVVGAIHLEQFVVGFSQVPVIGPLFLLNFVGATIVGLALLSPVERAATRWAGPVLGLLALGGISIAMGALAAVLISTAIPLFGVSETFRLEVDLALAAEVATTVLLGGFLATLIVARRRDPL